MINHNNNVPKVYIYFDTEGVIDIFSQTVERTEIESRQNMGDSRTFSGSSDIGSGNFLPINANLYAGASIVRQL